MNDSILHLLLQQLPNDLIEIKQALHNEDYKTLQYAVHKLHGAICYCNHAPLQSAIATLETAVKQKKQTEIPVFYQRFEDIVQNLLKNPTVQTH